MQPVTLDTSTFSDGKTWHNQHLSNGSASSGIFFTFHSLGGQACLITTCSNFVLLQLYAPRGNGNLFGTFIFENIPSY